MIYLDMDGVLADFDAGCLRHGVEVIRDQDLPRSAMTQRQLECDSKMRLLMETPGFFETLPPMPDAGDLWDFCAPYDPVILTGRPRDEVSAKRCTREKRAWIHRMFGAIPDERFICTLSSLKQTFIGHAPGRVQVLVDDRESNCFNWSRAGGQAIHHQSAEQSVRVLKYLLVPRPVPVPA